MTLKCRIYQLFLAGGGPHSNIRVVLLGKYSGSGMLKQTLRKKVGEQNDTLISLLLSAVVTNSNTNKYCCGKYKFILHTEIFKAGCWFQSSEISHLPFFPLIRGCVLSRHPGLNPPSVRDSEYISNKKAAEQVLVSSFHLNHCVSRV